MPDVRQWIPANVNLFVFYIIASGLKALTDDEAWGHPDPLERFRRQVNQATSPGTVAVSPPEIVHSDHVAVPDRVEYARTQVTPKVDGFADELLEALPETVELYHDPDDADDEEVDPDVVLERAYVSRA